jgi:hypothetical protein
LRERVRENVQVVLRSDEKFINVRSTGERERVSGEK